MLIKKPKCKFCENDGIIFANLDGNGKCPVCYNCYSKENEKRKKKMLELSLLEVHS